MAWFSRGIDFPPFYHPDEINKISQVQHGDRNFNHPQLMLNTAAALFKFGGSPESIVKTAQLTRWVSVFFTSLSIALLAYVASLLAGPIAQLSCGLLLFATPKLFELSHYLKEDPALALGFAAIYLAMVLYTRTPSTGTAGGLGVAAGLAVSAKYIGIYPAILALVFLLVLSWRQTWRTRHLLIFLAGCFLIIGIFNWQAIVSLGQFNHGLGREISLFEEKSTSLVNPRIIASLVEEISILAWAGLVVWLLSPWIRGRRLDASEWLIVAATFGYAAMLIFSSRAATRYLLPVIVSLPLMISVAACWLATFAAQRLRWPRFPLEAGLCLAIVIPTAIGAAPSLAELYDGFHSDSRLALVKYIRENISPNAVIAEDDQVRLPTSKDPRRRVEGWELPQRRVYATNGDFLSEDLTLDELRAKGVTHIVLFASKAEKKDPNKVSAKQRAFMAELEASGKLLWSIDGKTPVYINPPLRFYEIQTPAP